MTKSGKKNSTTKASTVRRMLARKKGATISEIAKVTCWQPHSIRSFLSSTRTKLGKLIKEERSNGTTAYRIIADAAK